MDFSKLFQVYAEAFPNSRLIFSAPDGNVVAIDHANDQDHMMPDDETEETFMDRIQRSKACGQNLFFAEWPIVDLYPDPTVVY